MQTKTNETQRIGKSHMSLIGKLLKVYGKMGDKLGIDYLGNCLSLLRALLVE